MAPTESSRHLEIVQVAGEVVEAGVVEQLPALLEERPGLQALVEGDKAVLVHADALPHQAAVRCQGCPVHLRLRLCAATRHAAISSAPAVLHAGSSRACKSRA